ncbi:MAG TPA: hypothetical protein VD962_09140 [Rubricoccaceae bacterium]|nr:hypothetical protein [Rubricoccaceae bacterium]
MLLRRFPVLAPLLLVALVFALQGCAGPRAARTGGGTGTLIVENNTNTAIYYLYVSPCESNSWGNDQLGSNETVQPGRRRSFQMPTGCWDFKVEFADGREVEERGVGMVAGYSRTWTLTGN